MYGGSLLSSAVLTARSAVTRSPTFKPGVADPETIMTRIQIWIFYILQKKIQVGTVPIYSSLSSP